MIRLRGSISSEDPDQGTLMAARDDVQAQDEQQLQQQLHLVQEEEKKKLLQHHNPPATPTTPPEVQITEPAPDDLSSTSSPLSVSSPAPSLPSSLKPNSRTRGGHWPKLDLSPIMENTDKNSSQPASVDDVRFLSQPSTPKRASPRGSPLTRRAYQSLHGRAVDRLTRTVSHDIDSNRERSPSLTRPVSMVAFDDLPSLSSWRSPSETASSSDVPTTVTDFPAPGTSVPQPNLCDPGQLVAILKDPEGRVAFKTYLGTEDEDASILFWEAVEEHKKLRGVDGLRRSAVETCQQFIVRGAPHMVRVSASLAAQLQDNAGHADVGFFERGQKEAFWRMSRHFIPFLQSEAYKTWKAGGDLGAVSKSATVTNVDASPRQRSKTAGHKPKSLVRSWSSTSARHRKPTRGFMGKKSKNKKVRTPARRGSIRHRSTLMGLALETLCEGGTPALLVHCHVWDILKQFPKELRLGIHCYYDKPSKKVVEPVALRSRRTWAEKNAISWVLPNSRPAKLSSHVNDYLDIAANKRPVMVHWHNSRTARVLFDNATIVTFITKQASGDLDRVILDTSLATKLQDKNYQNIIDACFLKNGIILSFIHKPAIAFLQYDPDNQDIYAKSYSGTAKVNFCDSVLGEYQKGRPGAYLTLNCDESVAVAWWPRGDPDFLSIGHVVMMSVNKADGMLYPRCCTRPDAQIYACFFSKLLPSTLYVVNSDSSFVGDNILQFCTYATKSAEEPMSSAKAIRYYQLKRSSPMGPKHHIDFMDSALVPLRSPLATLALSNNERHMLYACLGGDIMLAGAATETPLRRETALQDPVSVTWAPTDAFALVATRQGTIQCFDVALIPLWFSIANEELIAQPFLDVSTFGAAFPGLEFASWGPFDQEKVEGEESNNKGGDQALFFCSTGPAILMRVPVGVRSGYSLGLPQLVADRLSQDQPETAIQLLQRMDWNHLPEKCYASMVDVIDYLLKQPFSLKLNNLIRAAFPSFSWHISDVSHAVFSQYHAKIHALQWRYFNYLLRYNEFMLSLQLATELRSHEMCMALHLALREYNGRRARVIAAVAFSAYQLCHKMSSSNESFV
eukprot:m.161759 g.161759  ORF g.161759 m.161759 type:complete len:1075 (+) comp24864_c0_seq3:65-3289(+)